MSSIIKRRKTANYTQINNKPLQDDLKDLAAIGLLSYIMSLPEDWDLHKSYLHKRFSRRRVDNAWKLLVESHYIIGFYCHVNGKRQYYYNVSDLPFTKNDYDGFILDVIEQLKDDNKEVLHVTPIKDLFFNPSIVQNEQYNLYSTKRTTTKEIETKEIETNKYSLSIVNKQELINICNQFYNEFALGRWSKDQWHTLIDKFVDEMMEGDKHKTIKQDKLTGYIYQSIKNIASNHDYKHSDEYKEYQEAMSYFFE